MIIVLEGSLVYSVARLILSHFTNICFCGKRHIEGLFKKPSLLILTLLYHLCTWGQSVVYTHHTVENGLPSSQVYSAFQDSKGYMWFATDAGVTRYNGYEFENFNSDDGLTDNTVFLITEDSKGRIWFGTFNCQLSYMENDSIHAYEHNNIIAKTLKWKRPMQSFHVDSSGTIWIGFYGEGIYRCTPKGSVHQTLQVPDEYCHSFKATVFGNTTIWGKNSSPWRSGAKSRENGIPCQQEFQFEFKGAEYAFQTNTEVTHAQTGRLWVGSRYNNGIFYTSTTHVLLIPASNPASLFKNIRLPFSGRNRVLSVRYDGTFSWFCLENEGVYKCKVSEDSIEVVHHFLPTTSVSRTFTDKDGGLWLMTLSDGLYFVANETVKFFGEPNQPISAITVDTTNGQLYVGFENGRVTKSKLTEAGIEHETIAQLRVKAQDLAYNYNNRSLLMGGELEWFNYYQENELKKIPARYNGVVKAFLIDDQIIYTGNGIAFSVLKGEQEVFNSYLENSDQKKLWCTSLFKNKHRIWIGTSEGIRIYADKQITNPFSSDTYLSSYITSFARVNENTFLIGTKKYGILVVQNEQVLEILDETRGLKGNLVFDLHRDDQGVIWVATNKGLSRLNYHGPGDFDVLTLGPRNGIGLQKINALRSYRNDIYALTSKGFYVIDRTKIRLSSAIPPLHITQLFVDKEEQSMTPPLIYPYSHKFINIRFEGLSYTNPYPNYKYRIVGVDTGWINTTKRSVQFTTLPHGNYVFEVKVQNEAGDWNKIPARLTFTITPPYWKTWWFRILTTIGTVGLIYLGFRYNLLVYNRHIQQEIVNRLLKRLGRQSYITIVADKTNIRINEAEILFVEAFKNYVEINTTKKKYLYRSTMTNMEAKLNPLKFVRVHRSYIVQKDKIDSISEDELQIQDFRIPIGKTYQSAMKKVADQFFRTNT